MGMIGRWIDTLTDRERDAIIEHPDPTYRGDLWWDGWHNCGCLVGCVIGDEASGKLVSGTRYGMTPSVILGTPAEAVGREFPRLTARFTPERMWRLVKARAAKRHAPPLAQPAPLAEVQGD